MMKPPISRIRGIRLWSGILTESEFATGHIPERGAENDHDADQTGETNEGEADVGSREDGPGFHV